MITPKDGHIVVAISFSPSSDRFVVATGNAQPIVRSVVPRRPHTLSLLLTC
jgi:hypothetical protein